MVARWLIVVVSLVFILLVGAGAAWYSSFASWIVPHKSGDDDSIVAFRLEVERDYETKGVDFMEQMGNRLRQDESRVTGGNTKLFEFYSVLDDINCQCRDGDRKVHSFEDRQRRLQDWFDKVPQSVTARFAMATLWEYRAWQEIGGYGYRERLSDAQKAAFAHDLDMSRSYLRQLGIKDDPYVAFLQMRIMLDEGGSRGDLDKLFAESTAAWPHHYQIYFLYANLLTDMFGDEAARSRLMHELAAANNDPDKQVGLAYIVGSSFAIWSPDELPYADVVRAYYTRSARYGWRNRDWNAMCRIAMRAGDWTGAKYCFKTINGHWDDEIWQSQNEFVWNELIASLHWGGTGSPP
jgi:hypothetical protein